VVKPGMVMFEMDGVSQKMAQEAMELAAYKLPVKCKFVVKS
jgi:large subunit ribosomal protein L16